MLVELATLQEQLTSIGIAERHVGSGGCEFPASLVSQILVDRSEGC